MIRQILEWRTLPIPGFGPIRGERQYIPFRIEVCAFDRFGRLFGAVTETSDISESACKCKLRPKFRGDCVMAIRILKDGNRRMQPPSHSTLLRTVRIERTSWVDGKSVETATERRLDFRSRRKEKNSEIRSVNSTRAWCGLGLAAAKSCSRRHVQRVLVAARAGAQCGGMKQSTRQGDR
jgi:hypothetical protein